MNIVHSSVDMEYDRAFGPVEPALVEEIQGLARQLSSSIRLDDIAWRLTRFPGIAVETARCNGALVGFKAGYPQTSWRYYSWLGGVHVELRRQGIAGELMHRQHEWLRAENQYRGVETAVAQTNIPMLTLNLQHGFHVIGSYCRDGRIDLILHKDFVPSTA